MCCVNTVTHWSTSSSAQREEFKPDNLHPGARIWLLITMWHLSLGQPQGGWDVWGGGISWKHLHAAALVLSSKHQGCVAVGVGVSCTTSSALVVHMWDIPPPPPTDVLGNGDHSSGAAAVPGCAADRRRLLETHTGGHSLLLLPLLLWRNLTLDPHTSCSHPLARGRKLTSQQLLGR